MSGFRDDERLRVPPHSTEAEQSVLGGLMLAPETLAKLTLQPEDFYRRDHQLIFRAIQELDDKRQPFDAVTLGEWFESQGQLELVADGAYLTELACTVPSAANISAYAGIVRDKALKRQVIEHGVEVVNRAFDADSPAVELVDEAVGAFMSLARQESRCEFTLKQALNLAMKQITLAHERDGELMGVPSGIRRLDKRLGGFQAGDLVFIGARPKMGKTAILVNMACHAATNGYPVGIISGEQSATQLAQRMLALQTGVAAERMRNGDLEEEDLGRLTAGVRNMLEQNAFIFDRGAPYIAEIRRLVRKWKQEHGIKALYVDYLQRLKAGGKVKDRTEEVGECARALKDIARENDIAVISLAQVKREVEARPDKRPTAADIANSDEATREADQILMLYREEVYYDHINERKEPVRKGIAELNLEANRHGPTGFFELVFMPETMKFADLARDDF